MAKDIIEIEAKVKVDSNESVKSLSDLKKEFKDIQSELTGLQPGTEKYVQTLQRLGAVKDEIGDLRSEIQSFAGADAKIGAVTNVVGGLASGFAAAQGAAALFGGESEDLQKTLVKVQAAMAFAEGIKGVAAMGDSFKVLGNVIKSTTVFQKAATAAQWLWNAAMAANPIGAIVAALALLVGAIVLVVKAMEDEDEAQKKVIAGREREIEVMRSQNDSLQKFADFRKNLAAAQGKSAEDQLKLEKQLGEDRKKRINEEIQLLSKNIRERTALIRNADSDERKEILDKNQKDVDARKALYAELFKIDSEYIINKTKLDTENSKKEVVKKEVKVQTKKAEVQEIIDWEKIGNEQSDALSEEARLKENERQRLIQEEYETNAKQNEEFEYKLYQERKKRTEQELKDKQAAEQQKVELTKQGLNAIISLTDAFAGKDEASQRKAFNIKKAASLALATIETYQAAQSAYASQMSIPTPDAPIRAAVAAGLAVVQGLARVAVISKTKFEGGGGAASSSTGGAANLGTFTQGSTGQPPQGLTTQNNVTQLNPDGTVAGSQTQSQTVKAYVVESESRAVTERVNKLSNQSKIG